MQRRPAAASRQAAHLEMQRLAVLPRDSQLLNQPLHLGRHDCCELLGLPKLAQQPLHLLLQLALQRGAQSERQRGMPGCQTGATSPCLHGLRRPPCAPGRAPAPAAV